MVLMIVVASRGSSPGKAGAKMAVAADGSTMGTIGGGRVEFDLVGQANALLSSQPVKPKLLTKLHRAAAAGEASGMICGGEQRVALYRCGQMERQLMLQLARATQERGDVWLQATDRGLDVILSQNQRLDALSEISGTGRWIYRESIGIRKTVYIIGGGHVGLALSRVLVTLDFDIVVLDARGKLETLARNVYATEKRVVRYCRISDFVPEGPRAFVLVMTHGYRTDQQVLEQLAGKKFAYIGVLGSKRKIMQMKRCLRNRGVADAWLDVLHAPVGLPIHSHTPAEIAVSIAAELIQCCALKTG